jgi:hypothetical protein
MKATTVAIGVVSAIVVAVAMLLGPLSADPSPDTVERFAIFAYPICLLLAGVFIVLRTRIALIYGVLAVVFAVAWVVIHLSGNHGWETGAEKFVYTVVVIGPALIVASLCWSIWRLESGPALPTRL